MANIQDTLAKMKRGPSDVVGIDIQPDETRVVHMRKAGDHVTVLAADVLDAVASGGESAIAAMEFPPKLKGRYASVAVAGEQAVIKLLSFPGQFNAEAESKIVDNLGLEEPDNFRISYKVIAEGHGRGESRVLAVALPETSASLVTSLLPTGLPAPFSLEISGLATLSAFMHGPGVTHENDAVGTIHFGTKASTFALFNKGTLALIRRFDLGTDTILDKVQETLGVDRDTAEGIITDGAFDISQSVSEAMEPVIKQMVVSRDFVERRENCQIAKMYVSGGLAASRDSLDEMHSALGVEIAFWNPFEALNVASDAVPSQYEGQEWRFSGAVGAVLATLEES